MIIQSESHVNEQDKIDRNAKDKKGKVNVLFNSNTMGANDIKYEFRKTARHEIADGKSETVWDQLGRYLCIYGVKKPGPFDKEKRSVRIFSILGEQLHIIDKLTELSGFNFRPRPLNILSKKAMTALKADYRKNYGKKYKEEERKDTSQQQDEVRERKSAIINEFLNNFFLPLRQKYEDEVEWYQTNWPIKEAEYEKDPATVNHLYAYGD